MPWFLAQGEIKVTYTITIFIFLNNVINCPSISHMLTLLTITDLLNVRIILASSSASCSLTIEDH